MQANSSLPHRSATNQIIAQHGGHGWYKPPGDTTEMPAHELVDTVGSYYGTPFDGPAHCIDRLGETMRDGIKKPNRSSSLPDENLVAEGNGVILPDGIEYSKEADSAVTENKNQTTAVTNVACATLALATPYSIGKRGIVPKRRFQTGTFVKRGENWVGMWRVDVIQPDGTLKREQHSKTFVGLSERAARAAFQPILDLVNAENGAKPPIPKRTATLSDLVAEWREQIAGTLKPSSRKAAESHLRRHIDPLLGSCVLPELTAKRLQAFVTTLSAGTRTRKTIENVLLTLSSILSAGRTWGHAIPKVSISDLSLPQETVRKVRCYTIDAMRKIIHFADEPLATICLLLCVTGMRIGEALGLRVGDLDFGRKLINVRCSVYAGRMGTPKSKASIADLPMPAALESRLKSFLSSRHYRQNSLGLLFANRRGHPYSADKLRENYLRPLLAKLGIPPAGFHAFRHAVASELIDSGAPITVVQAQMRHSDPRITLGLYGHVIPQSQRDAIGHLAERLRSQLLTEAGIADSAA